MTDSAGNAAAEVQRVVTVGDTSIPVITLLGEATLVHEAKSNYSDAGATASDTLDGNITDSLVTVSTVNINKVGEYSVSYNVVDANGNDAATVKRVVIVKDSTIPIIVINGENAVTHEAATNYNDLGATASDTLDGNISTSISTVSNVNKGAVGDYSVKYNVTDANGNAAVEVVRVVKVVDTTTPVITCLLYTSDAADE